MPIRHSGLLGRQLFCQSSRETKLVFEEWEAVESYVWMSATLEILNEILLLLWPGVGPLRGGILLLPCLPARTPGSLAIGAQSGSFSLPLSFRYTSVSLKESRLLQGQQQGNVSRAHIINELFLKWLFSKAPEKQFHWELSMSHCGKLQNGGLFRIIDRPIISLL